MKKIILYLFLSFCLFSSSAYADIEYYLFLRIQNDTRRVLPWLDVAITEKQSGESQTAKTNQKGKVRFEVKRGKTYFIGFSDVKSYEAVTIPQKGLSYMVRTITYNPPSEYSTKQPEQLQPDTVFQEYPVKYMPKDDEIFAVMKVTDTKNKPLSDARVTLFSPELNKVFADYTDAAGEAHLVIVPGKRYITGIEEFSQYYDFDTPNRGTMKFIRRIHYEPTDIEENEVNDTISQVLPVNVQSTSMRVYLKMTIYDYQGTPLANEPVYFDVQDSEKVYKTVTNQQGVAKILLPKGERYVLSLKYERDLDVLDYPMRNSLHRTEIEYTYIGSEKVEDFYKNTKRDKNGFITQFMESKVTQRGFNLDLIEKTEQGFNVHFENQSPTSSPAFAADHIFTGGGYYSSDLFSFDAFTGDFRWGLELAEAGPSSVVYSQGIILLITQSCSLYAIEAESGQLLWSAWLGPDIYSTPTVANNKVFAVYPNKLPIWSRGESEDDFAIVAFDLHSGDILWQNRIESEVLSAAVCSNNAVYLTTQNGWIYKFDETTGEKIKALNAGAVTPPTIVDDFMYVSLRNKKDTIQEEPAIFRSENLTLVKNISGISGKLKVNHPSELSSVEQMNYNGSRVTHFNNRNYQVVGETLFCTHPKTGAIIWQSPVDNKGKAYVGAAASMPVIAGGNILIATGTGNIQLFDAKTGKMIEQWQTESNLYLQPIVHKGWIYAGTRDGKIISIDTKKPLTYTGWSMWTKDASHNPVVKQ